jgi:hypothetical protein
MEGSGNLSMEPARNFPRAIAPALNKNLSLPTTAELSRSALGNLLSKQGPLKSTKKTETAGYTDMEMDALLADFGSNEVTRASIGMVNTCLHCFKTSGKIKGQGDIINQIMFARWFPIIKR